MYNTYLKACGRPATVPGDIRRGGRRVPGEPAGNQSAALLGRSWGYRWCDLRGLGGSGGQEKDTYLDTCRFGGLSGAVSGGFGDGVRGGVSVSGPSGLRFGFRRGGFLFRIVVFLAILGPFLGGTPLRDHLFRPKGADGPPGRARDRFLTIFGGFWAPFWGSGEVVFRTFRQLFFGVFWVRLRGRFSEDLGSILEGISVPFGCLFGESRIW